MAAGAGSADWQSAVSPNGIRQGLAWSMRTGAGEALRIANPRYGKSATLRYGGRTARSLPPHAHSMILAVADEDGAVLIHEDAVGTGDRKSVV